MPIYRNLPIITVQDTKHAKKTARNQLHSGASRDGRVYTIWVYTTVYTGIYHGIYQENNIYHGIY